MPFDPNWVQLSLGLGLGTVVGLGLGLSFRPASSKASGESEGELLLLRNDLEDQARRWEALPNLLASLSSVEEPDKLFESIAFVTREHLGSEFSALLLRKDQDFVIQAGGGLHEETRQGFRLPVKEGLVRYIMETNRPVRLDRGDRQLALFRSFRETIREVLVAPLRTGADVFGLLWVANKAHGPGFSKVDLNLISYLALPFSLAIHNASVFSNSQRTVVDLLIDVCRQVEDRDPRTRGHSARVADLSVRVGRQLRMSSADVETLRIAALLHDLGRISLPPELWDRLEELSEKEREFLRAHPRRAVEMLKPLGFVERALPLILYHEERYDGSGHPFGLRGPAIPVGAAVIGMAETWDGLVSASSPRGPEPPAEAIRYLADRSGSSFDPQLLRLFLQVVEKEGGRAAGPSG